MRKRVITCEISKSCEFRYEKTHVMLRSASEYSLTEALEGTVDNKAGYGTAEAAARMGEKFKAAIDEGHTLYYDCLFVGDVWIRATWQHFEVVDGRQTYCSPGFEISHAYDGIVASAALLRRIGRVIERERAKSRGHVNQPGDYTFRCADVFIGALARLKDTVFVRKCSEDLWVPADLAAGGAA